MAKKPTVEETEEKKIKDMPARERILLLRLANRRDAEEGKRLNGKVSEAKTDFKNTLKAAVPDDGEEAKARLRQLQVLDEETQSRKDARSGFKQRMKTTKHALLFSEVSAGGQLVLPGAELDLPVENLRELRLAVSEVRLQDEAAKADTDNTPKYPIEDKADLAALDAELLRFINDAGITPASLGSAPTKDETKAETKRGKGAAAAPVH